MRLYLMSYFPSGFWSRLMTRLLADEAFGDILKTLFVRQKKSGNRRKSREEEADDDVEGEEEEAEEEEEEEKEGSNEILDRLAEKGAPTLHLMDSSYTVDNKNSIV